MSIKPVVKWVGGKRQLLDKITDLMPSNVGIDFALDGNRLYVEPFVGSGALWLDLQPKNAIINDKNKELMNMYRVVRDDPRRFLDALKSHAANNSRDYYYSVRAWDRDPNFTEMPDWKRAARFLYLDKAGYGGMYRVNKNGKYNTAYNAHPPKDMVNEAGILALHDYLRRNNIDIRCGDYADTLAGIPVDSFVYLDPPYSPISKTANFTHYTAARFDYVQQERLRDECVKLRDRGIPFIESNSDTPAIRELYKDFTLSTVQAWRTIAAKRIHCQTAAELLITA